MDYKTSDFGAQYVNISNMSLPALFVAYGNSVITRAFFLLLPSLPDMCSMCILARTIMLPWPNSAKRRKPSFPSKSPPVGKSGAGIKDNKS